MLSFYYILAQRGGGKNIATSLANALDRDVVAPRLRFFPELYQTPDKKVGEFAPDKNGKITFNYSEFRNYSEFKIHGKRYISSLDTSSHKDRNKTNIHDTDGKNIFY